MNDRVFCAKALLDILEEPARLTPAGRLEAGGWRWIDGLMDDGVVGGETSAVHRPKA